MEPEKLTEKTGISREAIQAARELAAGEHSSLAQVLAGGDLEKIAGKQPDPNLFALAVFLERIPGLADSYGDIPEAIFWDNLKDLGIWSRECQRKTGKPGLLEWRWNEKTFRRQLFRIGRLQFEPRVLEEEICAGTQTIPAGTEVLEVHIPAEEPLEQVEASFRDAVTFFERYFGKKYSIFHCHSWLLARELKELLPETSRIRQFQNRFTVYGEDYDFRQAEQRVFGAISDQIQAYPEETSLQRSLKRWLLDGHQVGMGAGIRIFPETSTPG